MSNVYMLHRDLTLFHGDMREVLRVLPDNFVDAVVTDPPYHLTSVVKRFGADDAAPAKFGSDGRFQRLSGGFMSKRWDAPDIPIIDPEFANWMAGFIDGEGCFSVHKKQVNECEVYDCQFSITLRDDDKDILVEMQKRLGGIGSIADRPASVTGNGKPQVRYCVSSQRDCWRLREILIAFPLRAKKSRDFQIWSQALDAWIDHEPGQSWDDVSYFRDALMAVKKYGSLFSPSQLFHYQWAREIFRVLKPGGHLLAMGGTRTYHRLACAIEDAGFEVRDMALWMYGTGFPKSHDISKAIDRAAGAEREKIKHFNPRNPKATGGGKDGMQGATRPWIEKAMEMGYHELDSDIPATDAAREWQGWGTALKPAIEPTCLARKPLSEATVAANVLRWGTGALNIDGCRVSLGEERKTLSGGMGRKANPIYGQFARVDVEALTTTQGRWPANLCHDGSAEVIEAFPVTAAGGRPAVRNAPGGIGCSGHKGGQTLVAERTDSGSAARFFYSVKASKADRAGSSHPTIKPIALKAYFIRLITPPGGIVLDPFAGTGTTGAAALQEGKRCLLIEREDEYAADIQRRFTVDSP